MIGHDLGNPTRYTGSKTIYRASCACGIDILGPTLPALWAAHDVHRGVVRAMWMGRRRHPSWREDA